MKKINIVIFQKFCYELSEYMCSVHAKIHSNDTKGWTIVQCKSIRNALSNKASRLKEETVKNDIGVNKHMPHGTI